MGKTPCFAWITWGKVTIPGELKVAVSNCCDRFGRITAKKAVKDTVILSNQIRIFSISSKLTSSPVLLYSCVVRVLSWAAICAARSKATSHYTPSGELSRLGAADYNQRIGVASTGTLVPGSPSTRRSNRMHRHRPAPPRPHP